MPLLLVDVRCRCFSRESMLRSSVARLLFALARPSISMPQHRRAGHCPRTADSAWRVIAAAWLGSLRHRASEIRKALAQPCARCEAIAKKRTGLPLRIAALIGRCRAKPVDALPLRIGSLPSLRSTAALCRRTSLLWPLRVGATIALPWRVCALPLPSHR